VTLADATVTALTTSPQLDAVGQYVLGPEVAAGGMGSVRAAFKVGALGFQRLVAVKRLHPHLASETEFLTRFRDEIRLVSRLTHPNIVQTFDVLELDGELSLVLEFVDGVTLHELSKDARQSGRLLPARVTVGILAQALHGLHAAHEELDERGRSLGLVHRDVSPQNIMIGRDGLAKVVDFGVAKAAGASFVTKVGRLSGKVGYMSPEQLGGRSIDRRTDVFAAGVVLWEALCGERLFGGPGVAEASVLTNVLTKRVAPPSELNPDVSPVLDRIVLRALDRDPASRYGSARDFALALEEALPVSASAVAGAVNALCAARLRERRNLLSTFKLELRRAPEPELGDATRPVMMSAVGTTTVSLPIKAPEPELQTADVQGALGASAPPLPAPRRRGRLASSMAVALLLSLLALGRFGSSPDKPSRAEPSRVHVRSASTALPESPPLPRTPKVEQALPAAPLRPEDLTPLPPLSRPAKAAPKAARPARAPSPAAVVAPEPCAVPTYLDAEGIRHIKAECL
jgi:serine/threonine protein kinase